jgi:hypothetical protein
MSSRLMATICLILHRVGNHLLSVEQCAAEDVDGLPVVVLPVPARIWATTYPRSPTGKDERLDHGKHQCRILYFCITLSFRALPSWYPSRR